jgi:alpha-tubulin suppressor-like RCC1 family protein
MAELATMAGSALGRAGAAASLLVAAALVPGCGSPVEPTAPPTIELAVPPSSTTRAELPAPRRVVGLALGFEHGCVVLADGSLLGWGSNGSHQLTGELESYLRPVRVLGVGPVREAAAGVNGTCVLERAGEARCWGGAFASLTREDYRRPFAVPGTAGLRSLSMRGQHACGLADDGSVRCWGKNDDGQLGDGTQTDRGEARPVSGVTGAVAVVTGSDASAAVTAHGQVWLWGDDHAAAPAPPSDAPKGTPTSTPRLIAGIDDAAEVALTTTMACARRRDGRAACWGDLPAAKGKYERSTTPVPVEGLGEVRQLVAGEQHVCALQADGTVACWGVVPGWHQWRPKPMVLEGLADVTAIAAGSFFQCALRRDGEVLCLGDDGAGQLGDGEPTRMRKEPVPLRW